MRDWLAPRIDTRPPRVVPDLTYAYVLLRVELEYPGGVKQFLANHKEQT